MTSVLEEALQAFRRHPSEENRKRLLAIADLAEILRVIRETRIYKKPTQ